MTKPTFASVTDAPCECEYLQRQADDPDSPIVFDPQLNEYNFEFQDPCVARKGANAMLRIYHCPFCGGAAPTSKRELLFAVITSQEEDRLRQLFAGIKTLDDAIRVLGPPDRDALDGVTRRWPKKEGEAPSVESFRTLTYCQLSETAEVHITEFREAEVHFRLQGKYIGPAT